MTNKQQEKENLWDLIQSLPNDPDYKEVLNMPIPLGKSVIVKQAKQQVIQVGGIILPDAAAENTQLPKVGVIYAVGPDCTRGVRKGLRCYYNFYCDLEIRINGETFVMMEEASVYYILRSNEQQIYEGKGVKSSSQVRREKKQDLWSGFSKRKKVSDENEKDFKKDKTKGKIRKIK